MPTEAIRSKQNRMPRTRPRPCGVEVSLPRIFKRPKAEPRIDSATMPAVRRLLAALLVVAGCGVRTPPPIDIAGLVARDGADAARRELTVRVLAHPRDVQARLALAALADKLGRPTEAIEQLEAVLRLGGPLGTRWHADDRARLGRLLQARGEARLVRDAASALDDLERARSYGAAVTPGELERARIAIAIAQLRHSAAEERAKGRATLAALASSTPAWRGAAADASAQERGAFGAWAWQAGARREAYEQLAAWHAATPAPRAERLQAAYLRALAWWSPVWLGEVAAPPAADLVGPERCWFPGTDCEPPVSVEEPLAAVAVPDDIAPHALAAARYALARTAPGASHDVAPVVAIATAFARDPAIAERLGRELVARAPDAALAHATLGALFDALGDPARARAAWQAAVDGSPEPAFVRGLAEAAARGGDGPAALVFATRAAAAWGDPAVVWTSAARALVDSGQQVDGLTAARNALDLAGPEVLPDALDVAIAASLALGRQAQADALRVQRAQLAPLGTRAHTVDADVVTALAAHRERPTAGTVARLWVVSRTYPRDVEARAALVGALAPDDARRATVIAELVALAGDRDPRRALAAVGALLP